MIAALAQNGKFKQIVDLNDFDLSKPSQTDQKTVISDLNGQKISNLQDVGFIGWIKITDAPDNDISYIIQSGYTAGDAITIVPFNAQFSMKNKLISYQCDMGSTYSPQKGTSQITIQKWFFFMCSFDIQNKVLRIFTYQEGTKVTSKLDLKDFSSLSAISIKDWEINYAMQSINKSKWIGNLRNIQFFYNINFSEFDSSFLSLVYGRYQMKYFLPFDTRRGNTIYDQNQGYSFPLKYKTVDPPAFELDGMGITYSALNQSIQLDNIELSSSIFISFWIKPTMKSSNLNIDSSKDYKVLTAKNSDDTVCFAININNSKLVLGFSNNVYTFGNIKDSEWHYLYLSIFISNNEFLLINSYFSATYNTTSTSQIYNLQSYSINYATTLFKVNIGGLIQKDKNGVDFADSSFIGTIKDVQISQGGAGYDGTKRNILVSQQCDILIGFSSDAMRCLLCKSQYFLSDKIQNIPNNCQKNACAQGFYKQNKLRQCEGCDNKCKACTGGNQSQCSQCTTGYYKLRTYCYDQCPIGYYNSPTSYDCFECDTKCLTCSGKRPQDCIDCKPGYFMNSGICDDCHKYCTECFGPKSSECTKCASTTFLYNTTCFAACPEGYFSDKTTQKCLQCDSSCLTCEQIAKNCLTCPKSTYLMQQSSYQTCKPCHSYCQDCFGEDNTKCITCNDDYFQNGNSCVEVCPPNKYRDVSGDFKSCQFCISPCQECYTKEKCTKCIPGYYYNPADFSCTACSSAVTYCSDCDDNKICSECSQYYLDSNLNQCVTVCSDGKFANSTTKQCENCDQACTKCIGPKISDCQACKAGYYLDSAESSCKKCPDNCDKCGLDPSITSLQVIQCLKCSSSYYLNNINKDTYNQVICQLQCGYGYFLNSDTTSITLKLDSSDTDGNMLLSDFKNYNINQTLNLTYCKKCSDKLSNCLSCDSNTSLCSNSQDYQCLSCDLTYYVSDCNCKKCSDYSCEQCININNSVSCTSCPTGSFLLNGACITKANCEINKTRFADTNFKVCATCNSICKTCDGGQDNNCLSCFTGSYYKQVDTGKYTCAKCPFSCTSCTDLDHCQSCAQNYYLDTSDSTKSQCVLKCPDTYYGNNGICKKCSTQNCKQCNDKDQCLVCNSSFFINGTACQACDPICQECQGSPNSTNKNCTLCKTGKKLYQLNCIDKCPDQTYEDSKSSCLNCDPSCDICTDKLSTNCSKCKDGFYFDDPSSCIVCDSSCKTCTGPGQSNCIECSKGFYKLGNATCLKQCIDGYYPDKSSWECKPCQSYCGKCTDYNTCQQCNIGYYQSNSSSPVTCGQCNSACKECISDKVTACISCNLGYYLDQKTCVVNCPLGQRGIDNLCIKCVDPNCAVCNPKQKDVCSVCLKDYSYDPVQLKCVQKCPDGYYSFEQYDIDKIPSDASQFVCSKCDISCQKCFGPSSTQCTQCVQNYYYHPETNECALQCQYGYIINSEAQNECKICSTLCLSCIKSQVLYQGNCYKDGCPFATEQITNTNICQAKLLPSIRIKNDPSNIQFKSDVIIEAEVISQIKITSQQWTIISPEDQKDIIFKGVETEFASLIIPVSNLKLDIVYVLKILVQNNKGSTEETFTFNTSQLIKVGRYDITSDSSQFISGSSKLNLELSGWQVPIGQDLKFDILIYANNRKEFIQNDVKYVISEHNKVKSVGSGLKQNSQLKFKTMPVIQDTPMTFSIRAYTDKKSVTVEKQITMLTNEDYKKILVDQEMKAQNITSDKVFGADDNFYLNFFGTNLPSDTEDIVIQMEIAKQLLKNNTYIQDAQFHEKNLFYQMLQSYSTSEIDCENSVDCLGKGQCKINQVSFSWTPLDPSNPTTSKLSESYKRSLHYCNCDPLYSGVICSWQTTYYQNITQKIREATVYIQQLPQNQLNPSNILNLYATISEFKDVIVQNFESIQYNTMRFLNNIGDQPIYFKFVNEIVMNYIDILVNYNVNIDQSAIQASINQLYTLHQQYTKNAAQYLYENEGMLVFQNNVYQLVLSEVDQKYLQNGSSSSRILKSNTQADGYIYTPNYNNNHNFQGKRTLSDDLFEFGDGSDILLSLYTLPSFSINANKIQALIPLQILTNPGKIVVRVQNFLINPFDHMINCTLINQYQISQIAQLDIFNQGQLLPTISMAAPITIVLKKLIRARPPKVANVTVQAYSCMNYMDTYKNWNSTHCSVQTENSTHIACSCYSLEGPVVVVSVPSNILTPIVRSDIILLNKFLNPSLQKERESLLISLGLWKPTNNTSQIQNYFGIYSFCLYCFCISLMIFSLASTKSKKDSDNANINPINRPYMHYHPLYSFFFGPTNLFITNNSRAFIILSSISSCMFYPSILVYLVNIRQKFSIIQIALISCAASVGTSFVIFGFPTFVKLGLSNLAQKKTKKRKAAFIGFSYNYLIQILALIYIIITQYFSLALVGSYENESDVMMWLKCIGFAYLFENLIDIFFVIYVMQRGVLDKLAQVIALRGYTLIPQDLLLAGAARSNDDDDGDDDIFEDENRNYIQNRNRQNQDQDENKSSSEDSENSIDNDFDDQEEEVTEKKEEEIEENNEDEEEDQEEIEEEEEEDDGDDDDDNKENLEEIGGSQGDQKEKVKETPKEFDDIEKQKSSSRKVKSEEFDDDKLDFNHQQDRI